MTSNPAIFPSIISPQQGLLSHQYWITGLQATLGTQLAKEALVEGDSCLADRIGTSIGHVQ